MNGFKKNKGIVLELTSLLDVIMIMLFWVMTDVSASADSQKEDAKAQVQKEMRVWKNPQMTLKSFDKNVSKDNVVLTALFDMPDVKAQLMLRYDISAAGEVNVTQKMTTDKEVQVADLFRFGLQLQMPATFSKLEYYGRGPEENYVDRHSSAFIGKYESDVKDEYYPYIRPQESGNHTDIRYFSIFNPTTGKGMVVSCGALT
jgi:beta-galactosidase